MSPCDHSWETDDDICPECGADWTPYFLQQVGRPTLEDLGTIESPDFYRGFKMGYRTANQWWVDRYVAAHVSGEAGFTASKEMTKRANETGIEVHVE